MTDDWILCASQGFCHTSEVTARTGVGGGRWGWRLGRYPGGSGREELGCRTTQPPQSLHLCQSMPACPGSPEATERWDSWKEGGEGLGLRVTPAWTAGQLAAGSLHLTCEANRRQVGLRASSWAGWL